MREARLTTIESGIGHSLRRELGCAIGIFAATLAAYGPALRAGLVWNDSDYLTKPGLRSLHGLWRIWFELGATEQYYPILHSAFWLEHRLWGDAPFGYHLINAIFHAAAACLFVGLLRRLEFRSGAAWFAGCLFALHPVCVESVAWISEQKNTLSTVFYLLAGLAYLRFHERWAGWLGRIGREGFGRILTLYLVATVLFVLALLSKTVTATLPAALLLVLWWKNGRAGPKGAAVREFIPLLPWLGLGAAAGLFSAWIERAYIGARGAGFGLSFPERTIVAGRAVWFYLGKLVWPSKLAFFYPRWEFKGEIGRDAFYPILAALAVALWLAARVRPADPAARAPLAAVLFFAGSLFPTLGFFNVYAFVFSYVADHWQYLAALGIFALAAAGWGRLGERMPRGGLAASVALGALFGVLTWRQCRMYRNGETLYRATLDRNPDAWLAQVNLGNLLEDRGELAAAIAHYRRAEAIVPRYPEIHTNLGDALLRSGETDEALREYGRAIALNPAYTPAQVNLANALARSGRDSEAIAHYEEALRYQPENAEIMLGLGAALGRIGRLAEAARWERGALAIRPKFPEGHYELGNALGNMGRYDEAADEYRQALRLRPNYPAAAANLGLALVNLGRPAEAISQLRDALRLRPDYPEAHAYYGLALARAGRLTAAAAEYREALRLRPGDGDVHYQLGLVLREMGRPIEAMAEFEAAERPAGGR